jgi:hypothetical protein
VCGSVTAATLSAHRTSGLPVRIDFTITTHKKKQSLIDSWVNLKMENAFIRIDQDYQSCNFNYKWIHNQTK